MSLPSITPPAEGQPICRHADGALTVPDCPIIPFVQGDGIGVDITPVMLKVVDAAVASAYAGQKKLAWMEVYLGEKAAERYDGDYFPAATLEAFKQYFVGIKGPLTTPVGGSFRSLNVALRQHLDLYACVRPVCWFTGVPSPVKQPELCDMVIFRENSEDIYAGIEWEADSPEAKRCIDFLQRELQVKFRFDQCCGIGIKPVSKEGSQRLIRQAIQYAIDHNKPSVTLVHKGNIMKFTEAAFKTWGYQLAKDEFGAQPLDGGPWLTIENPGRPPIVIKDVIADAMFQQVLLRPSEYSVIATLNLNGDYLSDALAAQVGGIGMAPGANIGHDTAIFEATHGTAPKYAGQDKVNPSSLILSAEMLLRHLGWDAAADRLIQAITATIQAKTVTYDLARLMPDTQSLSCSAFGDAMMQQMP